MTKQHISLPISKMLPNVVTLIGLCAGLFAIRFALNEQWQFAVGAVVVAGFLDGIDGTLARLLNASSTFGAHLDSFTDFISFGVAPALIIYLWQGHDIKAVGWAVTIFFTVCMAIRLARFNAQEEDDIDPKNLKGAFFYGVPAPSGAILCLLPLMLIFLWEDKLGYQPYNFTPAITLVYTSIIALLLVSNIPTPSLKKIHVSRNYSYLLLAFFAVFIIGLIVEPWITIPLACAVYILWVPICVWQVYR